MEKGGNAKYDQYKFYYRVHFDLCESNRYIRDKFRSVLNTEYTFCNGNYEIN